MRADDDIENVNTLNRETAEIERLELRARAAHALALYASISNIKWDYDDALAARGRLGGVVSVAASRSVKRFEIDDASAGGRAPFDVASDLWGLIDPAAL